MLVFPHFGGSLESLNISAHALRCHVLVVFFGVLSVLVLPGSRLLAPSNFPLEQSHILEESLALVKDIKT